MASHSRQAWRPFRERAGVRDAVRVLDVDEAALRSLVAPTLKAADAAMKAQLMRGVAHNEALLQNSKVFNDKMAERCSEVEDGGWRMPKIHIPLRSSSCYA